MKNVEFTFLTETTLPQAWKQLRNYCRQDQFKLSLFHRKLECDGERMQRRSDDVADGRDRS